MSFLRNITRPFIKIQENTRIFLVHSQQQSSISSEGETAFEVREQDPKDRSFEIDVDTSIRYVNSEAFKQSYGGKLIWTLYRRNKTRHFLSETRKTCIRQKTISTASPCPICRDMYLVLDHRNIKLLEQFIIPHTGTILPSIKTGLCQHQQKKLIISVMRAREYGLLSFYLPFQNYDYNYYKELSKKSVEKYKPNKQN